MPQVGFIRRKHDQHRVCIGGLGLVGSVGNLCTGGGDGGGVRDLATGLLFGRHVLVLGCQVFVAVRFGPKLLLQLLHHPLQVLPGLPLLQQIGSELLTVSLGVLQLHLEVFDLENITGRR